MNRSVPTLLGIMIILMVVMLVMLIYDYRLTSGLASGATVVGTVGGQLLTGVEQPTEQITASETTKRRVAKPINPAEIQRKHGKLQEVMQARERRSGRMPDRAARSGSRAPQERAARGASSAKPAERK